MGKAYSTELAAGKPQISPNSAIFSQIPAFWLPNNAVTQVTVGKLEERGRNTRTPAND